MQIIQNTGYARFHTCLIMRVTWFSKLWGVTQTGSSFVYKFKFKYPVENHTLYTVHSFLSHFCWNMPPKSAKKSATATGSGPRRSRRRPSRGLEDGDLVDRDGGKLSICSSLSLSSVLVCSRSFV